MRIRLALREDAAEWRRMRSLLWPDASGEHEHEICTFFEQPRMDLKTWVYDRGNAALGGFLEASIKSYAEGCKSDRVAYIEGLYVDQDLRQQGIASQFLQVAEAWARSLDLTEIASDCLIDNQISYQTHLANGFEEVERITCFRKQL